VRSTIKRSCPGWLCLLKSNAVSLSERIRSKSRRATARTSPSVVHAAVDVPLDILMRPAADLESGGAGGANAIQGSPVSGSYAHGMGRFTLGRSDVASLSLAERLVRWPDARSGLDQTGAIADIAAGQVGASPESDALPTAGTCRSGDALAPLFRSKTVTVVMAPGV